MEGVGKRRGNSDSIEQNKKFIVKRNEISYLDLFYRRLRIQWIVSSILNS